MKPIHIAIDLDKTLAYHSSGWGISKIGPPIEPMVENVKKWLAKGYKVTVFTARMSHSGEELETQIQLITKFLRDAGLPNLHKTATKLPEFTHIIDDRAYHVSPNSGIISQLLDI